MKLSSIFTPIMSRLACGHYFSRFGIVISSTLIVYTNTAQAQISPDSTLPNNTQVTVNGSTFNITGGTRAGANLFHSFREFSVPTGSEAFFNNAVDLQNIISRVTGGSISNIDGLIRTNGTANFFLINPSGIIFGQNASLNVGGSFVGTTANSLVFPNGLQFSATNPQASPLLSINVPIGLQFNSQPGTITNQAVNGLGVSSGTIALVGGEITLDGGGLFTQDGQVKLAAVGGDTTVGLNVNGAELGFDLSGNISRAPINLTNGSIILATGNSAIELFGGQIDLNGSSIFGGQGGSISVDATQFNLNNSSGIGSFTFSAAKGGDIQIQASDAVNITSGSQILSTNNNTATSTGGDVTINAKTITATGDGIPSNSGRISVNTNGAGDGGNLTLNATESVNIDGGFVSVGTNGSGNGGNLTLNANESVNINGGFVSVGTSGSGKAGDITIETQRVNLRDGGFISTSTFGSANAANIFIKAGESVEISGFSSQFTGGSKVSSDTGSGATGNGGNVTIETPRLTITQGGNISTVSSRSNGKPGNITIRATDVELDGFVFVPQENPTGVLNTPSIQEALSNPLTQETQSRFGGFLSISTLSSDVIESNTDVQGGTITIDTERLRLSNGGNISTSVLLGRGQGGNLVVRATDSIEINGVGPTRLDGFPAPSGLFAELQTGGIGSGGSIDVTTGRLNLNNGGEISAGTFNQGNAGNISLNANQIDLRGNSKITTQVEDKAMGNAGNINIRTQLLNVQEESQISSATLGNGNAGNLKVQADNIILTGSDSELLTGITSSVQEGANGRGRDIDITTNSLLIRNNAQVASSSLGNGEAGNIGINTNSLEINGERSSIVSSTLAGNGGDIALDIGDLLLLRRGGFISTSAGTAQQGGDGGNITINTPNGFIVTVPSEDSDITANAFTGRGGRVDITTSGIFGIQPRLRQTPLSDITASSDFGVSGDLTINTLPVDFGLGLVELPASLADAGALIASSCSDFDDTTGSNFTVTGRGGLPPSPDEPLTNDIIWTDTRIPTITAQQQPRDTAVKPAPKNSAVTVIPATGWVFNGKGEVTLISSASNTANLGNTNGACRGLK